MKSQTTTKYSMTTKSLMKKTKKELVKMLQVTINDNLKLGQDLHNYYKSNRILERKISDKENEIIVKELSNDKLRDTINGLLENKSKNIIKLLKIRSELLEIERLMANALLLRDSTIEFNNQIIDDLKSENEKLKKENNKLRENSFTIPSRHD